MLLYLSLAKSGRRTFASRLLANGHSLETVQLLLGHADLGHVEPYLEVLPRERRAALAGFDEWLD
ncbi:tyrosine-type recombinase/integrase [Paraburkholderia ultramafica]|uniref:tyrosine-type recombinase/integrase n=1 Tax=Paraburkholderia ultramafica TaxID=1544867 RepID=UPI0024844654|nr:tyrosine-type recombinase/integrase [Paraburkholderia ultramafica]